MLKLLRLALTASDSWRQMCAGDTVTAADPRAEYWNGRMIPFQYFHDPVNDERQPYGVIDSAVGDTGWDDGTASVFPGRSYVELLRANADALRDGTAIDGWRPRVVRGALRWEPPE
ncbi:hypothetical protein ACFXJ8_04190 [Nonomuraea sp. NPDC059194]|uniref:hypothetical protein n=1 Tax=Nonomuraea sp. NPDC059194 TaxID=3346764 RepID=UPI0036B68757